MELLVLPGGGELIPTDEIKRTHRQIQDGARYFGRSPDLINLTEAHFGDEMPWPKGSDIELLAERARDEDLWDYLEAATDTDAWSEKGHVRHQTKQKAGKIKFLRLMLAIAAVKSPDDRLEWARRMGSRQIHPMIVRDGMKAYYEGKTRDEAAEDKAAPSIRAIIDKYTEHVREELPGEEVLQLEMRDLAKLRIPGYTVTSLDSIDDIIFRLDHPHWHTRLIDAEWDEEEDEEDSPNPLYNNIFSGGFGRPEASDEAVHILRYDDADGNAVAYAFTSVFMKPMGYVPATDRETFETFTDAFEQTIKPVRTQARSFEALTQI